MSLAQSILEYICNNIGAKTMFSTHYHELTSLSSCVNGLKNIHVEAVEENGEVTFLHKIKSGPIDKSYGLHVAKLAGLPDTIINRSKEILNIYESNDNDKSTYTQMSLDLDNTNSVDNEIVEQIKNIDPLSITPLDALNFLYDLKKKI